jgi:hypothetical protein
MKKVFAIVIALVLMLSLVPAVVLADKPDVKGNGIDFNGEHFNLNLIGKDKDMPGDYDNADRHTMFVPLSTEDMTFDINESNNLGTSTMDGIKIVMSQSDDPEGWEMIDGNATDGYGEFKLADGRYAVYIAVKAKKPGTDGRVDITGWVEAYDNTELNQLWYYVDVGDISVSKNCKKFTDASDLFWVTTDEDTFGMLVGSEDGYEEGLGMWVFDYMAALDVWTDGGYDLSDLAYFLQLQNNGAKLIQVRFYPYD